MSNMRRAKTSDDPSLKDLNHFPSVRKLAQQEYLDFEVTSWRLQYCTNEDDGNIKELWQLKVSTVVPRDFRSDFESVDVTIYAVVRHDASSDSDPAPLGRVVANSSGVLDVYLPMGVSTFNSLTSCLQAESEETHNFVIRVVTEHSLKELKTKGFIRVVEVILDFVEIDDMTARSPTASPRPKVLKAEHAIAMLHSIQTALWFISALGLIAIATKMFA